MSLSKRRTLVIIAALVLLACLCLAIAAIGLVLIRAGPSQPTSPVTSNRIETFPDLIPSQVARQMDEIQSQVIELRGLKSTGPVDRVLLTPAELRQRVRVDLLKDYTLEEAEQDVITLSAFGLLAPGFDLYTFYQDLLNEQIAGFYDHEIKAMYVVQGESFQGPERITYAHEFIHALQDQTYDLKNGLHYDDERCETETERCAALQALIEGDASLGEFQWFQEYATLADQRQILAFSESYQQPTFAAAPPFLQEDFLFPYVQGFDFVQSQYNLGGWGAVDRVYKNPPVSTEQILHPERYPDDAPVTVVLPDLVPVLGESWKLIEDGTWGQWYTFLLLAHGIDPQTRQDVDQARLASQGWSGDTFAVYQNSRSGGVTLILNTIWDTPEEADEFAASLRAYGQGRFGPPGVDDPAATIWQSGAQTAALHVQESRTTWIVVPDPDLAEAIWDQIAQE